MTDRQRVFCWFHLVLLAVFLLNKLYAFPSTSTVVSDFLYACGSLRCMCAACASVYTRVCVAAVCVCVCVCVCARARARKSSGPACVPTITAQETGGLTREAQVPLCEGRPRAGAWSGRFSSAWGHRSGPAGTSWGSAVLAAGPVLQKSRGHSLVRVCQLCPKDGGSHHRRGVIGHQGNSS